MPQVKPGDRVYGLHVIITLKLVLFFLSFFLSPYYLFFMNIFVTRLNYNTDENELRNAFENYGTVDSVKIVMDRDTNRSKGFGFVEMPDNDEAKEAINALNDSELDQRTIVVKESEPRGERRPSRRY